MKTKVKIAFTKLDAAWVVRIGEGLALRYNIYLQTKVVPLVERLHRVPGKGLTFVSHIIKLFNFRVLDHGTKANLPVKSIFIIF